MAVLTLMVVSSSDANAQTHWTYSYDATGNRVQRNVSSGSAARQTVHQQASLLKDNGIEAIIDDNHTRIKVETLGQGTAEISIYDLTGKLLLLEHSTSEVTYLDLGSLRSGSYILSVEVNARKRTCKFNK